MNMNLTSEEIALIEQKREEKRKLEMELKKSYDHYKEGRINAEKKRCAEIEKDAENLKTVYETNFNALIKVSKDFVFECEKVGHERIVDLYELDDNGYEIRHTRTDEGYMTLKPKEVIKMKTYSYKLNIKYSGNVPEGHNYYVVLVAQYSKYSNRINGYKMQVQGTGISSWDKRGQMTNHKKVYEKIAEAVDTAFKRIEHKNAQQQSNKRIKDRFELEFSKFANQSKNVSNNEFVINLDNDIRVTFYGHEDGNGNICFNNPKVSLPYNKVDIKSLLEALSTINGGE